MYLILVNYSISTGTNESPNSEKPPSKRQRKGSSPKQGNTNSVGYS